MLCGMRSGAGPSCAHGDAQEHPQPPAALGRKKGSPAAWAAPQSPCTPALSMSYCPRSRPVPELGWVLPWGRGQHLGRPPAGTFPHPSLSQGGLIARSPCPGGDLLPRHGEIARWAERLGLGDGGRRGVRPPPRLGGSPHSPLGGNLRCKKHKIQIQTQQLVEEIWNSSCFNQVYWVDLLRWLAARRSSRSPRCSRGLRTPQEDFRLLQPQTFKL